MRSDRDRVVQGCDYEHAALKEESEVSTSSSFVLNALDSCLLVFFCCEEKEEEEEEKRVCLKQASGCLSRRWPSSRDVAVVRRPMSETPSPTPIER